MPQLALKQPTLSQWIKNEDEMRENSPVATNQIEQVRAPKHADLEEQWEDFDHAKLKLIPEDE
ncbi:hypothetical protein CROQUDRAFT_88531 [Cronartium quercuum f. sp. fusiforme G11]|uniref:Uncharacterized protein n=1 Tax=Cronartium quercuum f. sp. fusiforme G11 TaxID=708437 RepID=A0A9P6NMQ6_9BASI|nr:hypothetical protein CROQUDRAFT_88531 [Cronartium quercuum f. sp. fusiforme G11]